MILVVDALNKHKFQDILNEMFRLRARVFGERLGWDVDIVDGMEKDQFDALDPTYGIGIDDSGQVVACVRALQTTGPHMLSDVFSDILGGEPPLRDPLVWESTRFCVDTALLDKGTGRNSVARFTSELMIASIETAMQAGVTDVVTVIDPVMNRVMKRSGNAPYDYLGQTVPMGKVAAMAALLDVSDTRIQAMRDYAGIDYDVFLSERAARTLFDSKAKAAKPTMADLTLRLTDGTLGRKDAELLHYFLEQMDASDSAEAKAATLKLITEILTTTQESPSSKA